MGSLNSTAKAAESKKQENLIPLPSEGVITLPDGGIISNGTSEINLKIYFSKESVIGPHDGPAVGPVGPQDPPKVETANRKNESAAKVINPQDGVGTGVVGNQDPPKGAKKILNISVYF